jgi:colanic acid biosynthesis glycosyl transferase WcaI
VLIVSAWYPPEPAPFGQMMHELGQALIAAGFDVTVVTNCPNHPQGVLHEGYRRRWLTREQRDGVRVLRVYTWARAAGSETRPRSIWSRGLALALFTSLSWIVALFYVRPTVIFGVLQPLTVGLTLPWLARLKRARLILNIQDLHPDALVDLGLVRKPALVEALRKIERYAYRQADALTVICEGFRDHCVARGAAPQRVEVIPNWLDLDEVRPLSRPSRLRAENAIADDEFIVLFAGTIGLVSGAEVLVDAAYRLREERRIRFVFVGDGPLVPELRERVTQLDLDNVVFMPFQPREQLMEVQGLADVSVVTLKPKHGRTSVPSKVLGYMAAARPVLASVDADSETARLVESAGCGRVVPAQDPDALAEAIEQMAQNRVAASIMGRHGREHLERHYSKPEALNRYVRIFRKLSKEAA